VPWSDYPRRLGEELIESIWFNGDIQYLKNRQQVVVTGCVYKFCSQKGFIFAYKDNFIGLIQHGNEEFDKEDFLVFSKKHKNLADLPDDFFAAVKEWINKTNTSYGFVVIEPQTVRFLGSDNKIRKAENLFLKKKKIKKTRKKVNEVEIVKGYEGILEKQIKDKANAFTKNYNADLFDLINNKDTARTILKGKEFEYALSKEINEKWIDFSRKGKDRWSFLNEKFYYLLFNSSLAAVDINTNNSKFFIVSGCADISCDEGALLYIDKKKKIVIGTIIHKYLGKDNSTELSATVVFSKKIDVFTDLPVYFYAKHALFMNSIYLLTKRKGDMMFIGSDNKDIALTPDEILGFNGK
jgi:cyclophilin family peptidyl-prolyl cis-trans isomerase